MSLIVVTGMAAEARIAVANGVTIVGSGGADQVSRELDTAVAAGARRFLSFGIAGALIPELRPGDLVLPHAVRDNRDVLICDPDWRLAMSNRLQRLRLRSSGLARFARPASELFRHGRDHGWRPVLGATQKRAPVELAHADEPVAEPKVKAALAAATGAVAVDMESMIVARAAQRHRLPFAILRVVADPSHRPLPSAALVAMNPEGKVDLGAVFAAIARDFSQLSTLALLAFDVRRAFSALAGARYALGPDFASREAEEFFFDRRETGEAYRPYEPALPSYARDMA